MGVSRGWMGGCAGVRLRPPHDRRNLLHAGRNVTIMLGLRSGLPYIASSGPLTYSCESRALFDSRNQALGF